MDIQGLRAGDRIEREGIALTVNTVSWAKGTTVEEAIARTGEVAQVVATQDGRHLDERWCDKAGMDEAVYFTVERADGTGWHGWLDAETRRVLQTG